MLKFFRFKFLGFNDFVGPLPNFVGDLASLIIHDVERNRFDGTLPTSIGKLSNTLEYLALKENLFTGTIPNDYGALMKIRYFTLTDRSSRGGLKGTLPDFLGSW